MLLSKTYWLKFSVKSDDRVQSQIKYACLPYVFNCLFLLISGILNILINIFCLFEVLKSTVQ